MAVWSEVLLENLVSEPRELNHNNGDLHYFSVKAHHKEQNQDGLLLIGLDENVHVMAVVDGMGGHLGGEKAARVTIETIKNAFTKKNNFQDLTSIRSTMLSAAFDADRAVKGLKIGAGATIVAAIIFKNEAQIFNAGDAKGYFLGSKGRVKFETVEHSPSGYYKEAKGEEDEDLEGNIISNGIGFEPMSVEVSQVMEITNHDIFLLCSDGLFHVYPANKLADWGSSGKFETRVRETFEFIAEKGPENLLHDDTTLILARFKRNSDNGQSSEKISDA